MVIITSINNIIIESFFVEIDLVKSFNHCMKQAYKYLFGISRDIVKYLKILIN
jgi:hypothetical protein